MTDRKKPTAGFWIIVALVAVLVGYPLSFGPAVWLADARVLNIEHVAKAFRPIIILSDDGPMIVRWPLDTYGSAGGRCKTTMFRLSRLVQLSGQTQMSSRQLKPR